MRPFRASREQPPTVLARPSPTVPGRDWEFSPSKDRRDKVRIRIINKDGIFVEHGVHRSVIQTSPVLRKKLHGSLIWLKWNGRLDVFNMYAAWLYKDTILTNAELLGRPSAADTTKADYKDLVSCWGMGMILDDDEYVDELLESIEQRLQAWKPENGRNPFMDALTALMVSDIYRETETGAPMRTLIVDNAAKLGEAEDFEDIQDDSRYPPEFLRDLMVALGREGDRNSTAVAGPAFIGSPFDGPALIPTYVETYPPPPWAPVPRRALLREGYPVNPWLGSWMPPPPAPFFNAQQEMAARQPCSILKNTPRRKVRFGGVKGSDSEPEHYF